MSKFLDYEGLQTYHGNLIDRIDSALDDKADKSTTYTKTEVDTALSSKQNTISDLSTIRSGAALGATAVQPAAMEATLAQKQDALNSAQLAAVNSGITSADVAQITTNKNNISNQQDAIADGGNGYAIINSIRLYVNPPGIPPTGDIPDGSYGLF